MIKKLLLILFLLNVILDLTINVYAYYETNTFGGTVTVSTQTTSYTSSTFGGTVTVDNNQTYTQSFGGTVNVYIPGLAYHTITFGGTVSVSSWGNWSDWWVMNATANATPPTISNPYPPNQSENISLQPQCHIQVNDSNGDTMTVKFYENTTGSWKLQQTNITTNATVYWTYTNATSEWTTYWWKVSVNDSYNTNTSIYHFKTLDNTPPTSVAMVKDHIHYLNGTSADDSYFQVESISDSGSGIKRVDYYTRHSSDNSSWSSWTYRINSTTPPTYNTTGIYKGDGPGYYQIYSIAVDNSNNSESTPTSYDDWYVLDSTDPTSSVNAISPYEVTSSPLTINVTASDAVSGVSYVELYYRYSSDNSTWNNWQKYDGDDDSTPYQWSFNFPDSNGYYEFYSIATDKCNNTESAPVSADTRCHYNQPVPPSISNPYPANSSTNIPLQPTCHVDINDSNNDTMTIYWYENTSGSWQLQQINSSVLGGTYYWTYTNASNYTTTYYWMVSVNDSIYNTTSIYHFTTKSNTPPSITNVYPINGSSSVVPQPTCHIDVSDSEGDTMTIYWYENSTGSWVLRQVNSSITNGTYYWHYTQANQYNTTYYWKIAVNDSYNNNSYIYHFTTVIHIGLPSVQTNSTTGVEETNATLHGYLVDDGGENCTVGFEWGVGTTSNYGNNTYYDIVNDTASGVVDGSCLFVGTRLSNAIKTSIRFEPDIDINISQIKVNISSYTGSYYNTNIDIYISSGGADTSWEEGTKVKSNWNPSWSVGWQTITLDTTYTVTANQIYEIEFITRNTSGSNNYLGVSYDGSFSYPTGIKIKYGTHGNTIYGYGNLKFFETANTGDEISSNLSSLQPGQLYHYRAYATNSNGTSYGSDKTFLTKPLAPTLSTSSYNHTHVLLTWTKGTGANNTVIRRSTSGYPTLTTGTLIYNGTSTSYDDTNITPGTKYYYSAWSYTSWSTLHQYSDNSSNLNVSIPPQPPQNVTYNLVTHGNTANITITWDKGIGADTTLIRKSSPTPPSTTSDGTLVYNSTSNTTTDSNINQAWSYRLWSYNSTLNLYSEPVDLNWSAIWLMVYNESSGELISPWSAIISDQQGSQAISISSSGNPYILNTSECPHGTNTLFVFSAPGYKQRSYYYNIQPDSSYTIKAYLPPNKVTESSTGGGGSSSNTENDTCETRTKYDVGQIINTSQDVTINFTYNPTSLITVETFECSQIQYQTKNDIQSITDTSQDLTINTSHPIHEVIGVYVYNSSSYGQWVSVPDDKYTHNDTSVTVNHTAFDDNSTMVKVYYYYIDYSGSLAYGAWIAVPNDKYTSNSTSITVNHTAFTNNSLLVRVTYYYLYCYSLGTETPLYTLQVVGWQGEFTSPPIENAKVTVKKYMNTTGQFETVAILLTDANGQADVYLMPGTLYKIVITKDNYETEYSDYIPTLETKTRTFRLTYSPTATPTYTFYDLINITTGWCSNGFYVIYNDTTSSTVSANFSVYGATNHTLLYSKVITVSNYNFTYTGNTSWNYLWQINTQLSSPAGNYSSGLIPAFGSIEPIVSNSTINDILSIILGPSPLYYDQDKLGGSDHPSASVSWAYILIFIVCFIWITTFGKLNTSIAGIGTGSILIFSGAVISGVNQLFADYTWWQGASLILIGLFVLALSIVHALGGVER